MDGPLDCDWEHGDLEVALSTRFGVWEFASSVERGLALALKPKPGCWLPLHGAVPVVPPTSGHALEPCT